jgi:hypothetical protein
MQLNAYELDMDNDEYQALLALDEGDLIQKTDQIPKLILDGLNHTLNKVSLMKEITLWVKEKNSMITTIKSIILIG